MILVAQVGQPLSSVYIILKRPNAYTKTLHDAFINKSSSSSSILPQKRLRPQELC